MDDSPIQTALCVIGHPIGGNPTQFVAARALASLGLDWQFLSFDVEPSKIQAAISGIDSLGFCGAMIAEPYQADVARYVAEYRGEFVNEKLSETWYDFLVRNEKKELVLNNLCAEALTQIVQMHETAFGNSLLECLLIGDASKLKAVIKPFSPSLPVVRSVIIGSRVVLWNSDSDIDATPENAKPQDAKPQDFESREASLGEETKPLVVAKLVNQPPPLLILWAADAKPGKKNASKSPALSPAADYLIEHIAALHPQSLCIDLTGTARSWFSTALSTESPPITIVDKVELDVRRLAIAIQRWTSLQPNLDAMREAIEEYLEV